METKTATPGPNAYYAVFSYTTKAPPAFSIRGRPKSSGPRTESPPPNAYRPITGTSSPSFTMKSRTTTGKVKLTPGPQYFPAYQFESPKFSFATRTAKPGLPEWELKRYRSVSPNAYVIKSDKMAQSFTIKGRTGTKVKSRSPGPAQYSTEAPYKRLQRSPPCYSLHAKHKDLTLRPLSPGPSNYNTSPKKGYAGFTIKGRTKCSAVCCVNQLKFFGVM